jgi:WD40 repeat protein
LHAARRRLARQPEQVRYNAFLSYSHQADGALAPRLRSALQGFARRWNQLRAVRVFLDAASLAANPGLWPAIADALDDSEYLLLLASPEATASRYVARELEHWRATKPEGQILIGLTDGEIVWSDADGDFDWATTTALPPVLRGAFTTEPRWIDLRWAREAPTLSLRDDRFRAAVADLAATLHHRDKDELAGEDVRQHRRTTLLARGASLTLAALAVATTVAAVLFLRERDAAREQTRVSLSRQLAAQSALARDSRIDTALLLGGASLAVKATNEARSALFGALAREPRLETTLWSESELATPAVFIPPDGHLVAAGNEERDVLIWDRVTHRRVRTLHSGLPAIVDLAVSADGNLLVAQGENDRVLWDLRDDAPVGTKLPSEEAFATAFSPDGRLATASSDDSIYLGRPGRPGRLVAPARGRGYVGRMAFDASGRRLATVGYNGIAQIWTIGRRTPVTLARARGAGRLWSVAWHGNEIAAGTGKGAIARWNAHRPEVVRTDSVGNRQLSSIAFSPDGGTIAAADGTSVTLVDTRTGRRRDRFATTGQASSVAYSPDGAVLATSGADGAVSIWSARRRRPVARELRVAHRVSALAFDRSGTKLVIGPEDGPVVLWDLQTGQHRDISPSTDGVTALSFDSSGSRLAVGGWSAQVRMLDTRSGGDTRPVVKVRGELAEAVAIDAAGTLRAIDEAGFLWEWPRAGGVRRTRVAPSDLMGATALSADGSRTAFDRIQPDFLGGAVVAHDLGKDRRPDRKLSTGTVGMLAMSPNGEDVVIGGLRSVSVMDARDGTLRLGPLTMVTLPHHQVMAVAVAGGARRLAAGDSTGHVRVWDGDSGTVLGIPLAIGHGNIGALALSDDGRRLAIGAPPGVVLISLDDADWLRQVCPRANRGLTTFERRGLDVVKPARDPDPCRGLG